MTKPEMIALVERYFAAVDGKDLDGLLATLAPDCQITVETAGVQHTGREGEIREMFGRLFDHLETLWHGDFHHVADEEAGTIASQFIVKNLAFDGKRETKHNCNFFRVENGALKTISVYMSGANTLN